MLCQLINKLAPGSVAKVNTSGGQFKMMENINNFSKAIKVYGVPDIDVFQTVDLWEQKDVSQVTSTLFALGRAVSAFVCYISLYNPLPMLHTGLQAPRVYRPLARTKAS